jgi:hypothetical protein
MKGTPKTVRVAACRIWAAIRNEEHGSQLNGAAYEERIAAEILRVVEPFRTRSEQCGRDRRRAVANLHEALALMTRMRRLLKDIRGAKLLQGHLAKRCTELIEERSQHWHMTLDEPEEKREEKPASVSEDVDEDEMVEA